MIAIVSATGEEVGHPPSPSPREARAVRGLPHQGEGAALALEKGVEARALSTSTRIVREAGETRQQTERGSVVHSSARGGTKRKMTAEVEEEDTLIATEKGTGIGSGIGNGVVIETETETGTESARGSGSGTSTATFLEVEGIALAETENGAVMRGNERGVLVEADDVIESNVETNELTFDEGVGPCSKTKSSSEFLVAKEIVQNPINTSQPPGQ